MQLSDSYFLRHAVNAADKRPKGETESTTKQNKTRPPKAQVLPIIFHVIG